MSSSIPPPPRVKSPLPMIPVPQALETVLTETATSLWLDRQLSSSSITTSPSSSKPSKNDCHQLQSLIGRISAFDIKAPQPGYPNHNASIMDGYAVKTSDLASAKEMYDGLNGGEEQKKDLTFDIVGRIYAGDDDDDGDDERTNQINSRTMRTAVYVTTGAVLPTGYDAVIPIEDTSISEANSDSNNNTTSHHHKMHIIPSKVQSVLNSTKPNTWIRPIGCDIPPEYVVLSKGEEIQPVHLALLAQIGTNSSDVHVKRLPRVGILSTGNELLSSSTTLSNVHSQELQLGKIPDVNRPLLLAQLSTYGNCIPVDMGIVTDDDGCEVIAQRLNRMLWPEGVDDEGVDVLITTGGISMGEKDIMEQVFVDGMGGHVHFGRMNMKPGKPTTFITIDRTTKSGQHKRKLIFALPGNPVSASVCTELLVRPCLDLLHDGIDNEEYMSEDCTQDSFVKYAVDNARVHEEIMATITSDIKLDQGRPEYRRVTLQRVPSNGSSDQQQQQQYTYHATHTGVQRSSRVLSLRGADGLMMLPRGGPSGCGYDIAKKGLEFPVLLYSSVSSLSRTCFKDSMHRGKLQSNQHDMKSKSKLALGVIICSSSKQPNEFLSIDSTLVTLLGDDNHASVVQRAVCNVDDMQISTIVNGPQMEGTNVIFVIAPTDPIAEENGSAGSIAFKASLEVAHALRPILTKSAPAMAQQIRVHAASHDPVAALFEYVAGTVRDNSSLLITCSDRGMEGAIGAVKGLLGHAVSILVAMVIQLIYPFLFSNLPLINNLSVQTSLILTGQG